MQISNNHILPEYMTRKLSLMLAICLLNWTMYAGTSKWNASLSNAAWNSGLNTLTVLDPMAALEAADPNKYVIERRNIVRLIYERNEQTDVISGDEWIYTVNYNIGATGGQQTPHSLQIKYVNGDYIYESVGIHGNHADVTLEVTSVVVTVNGNSASSTDVPNDIRLDLELESTTYTVFDANEKIYLDFDPIDKEITWSFVAGAEAYDVEWTYLDEQDGGIPTWSTTNDAEYSVPFDYKKGTRIRSPWHHHELDLTYPKGTLYFRVRAVGRHLDFGTDYSRIKTGEWFYTKADAQLTQVNHVINQSFEGNKNWQYIIAFAEDGKSKESMTYQDGSLRQRQAQSHLSTDNVTIVGERKYDYEGRPVVSILPTPKMGTDFNYISGFNVANGTGTPFEKEHFDLGTSNPMHAMPNANGVYGAAQYYSTESHFLNQINGGFIPKGNGHEYSQVKYTNDGTGRIRSSSSLGDQFKLGSGHESKNYYATPTSAELLRLFGTNVGNVSHYKKMITVDPNGQVAIAYLDQEGRTIATALAGDAPDNLIELDGVTAETIHTSLNDNNELDLAAGTLTSVNKIANTVATPTNYDFNYQLNGEIFTATLTDPYTNQQFSICADCAYDLIVTITGPDGLPVPMTYNNQQVTTLTEHFSNPSALSCADDFYVAPTLSFVASFDQIGEYTVMKILKADMTHYEAQLPNILASVAPNLSTIVSDYQNAIDLTLCDVTCEHHFGDSCHAAALAAYPGQGPGSADYDAFYNACILGACAELTDEVLAEILVPDALNVECAGIYSMMLADLNPNGGDGNGGWLYLDDAFLEAYRTDLNNHFTTTYADVTEMRANWNEAYAQYLVQFHREHCHFQACLDGTASRLHDVKMARQDVVPNWLIAQNTGYFNPTGRLSIPGYGGTPPTITDPFVNDLTHPNRADSLDILMENISYNGLTYSLWEYVALTNNGVYSVSFPHNNVNQWHLFRQYYLQFKQQVLADEALASNCSYYNDGYEIVSPPLLANNGSDLIDFTAPIWAQVEDCDCQSTVDWWMEQLAQTTDCDLIGPYYANVSSGLLAFCNSEHGCGFSNPQTAITNWHVANDPNIQYAISAMPAGCSIDILVTNPYQTNADLGDSILYDCYDITIDTLNQPCVDELYAFINAIVLPSINGTTSSNFVNFSGYPNLTTCINATSIIYDPVRGHLTANGDVLFELVNSNNVTIPLHDLSAITNPYIDWNPVGFVGNNHYSGVANLAHSNNPYNVQTAYVISFCPVGSNSRIFTPTICFDYIYSYTKEICTPKLINESYTYNPELDQAGCIEQMLNEAATSAGERYDDIIAEITTQFLNEYLNNCLDVKEDFDVTYNLKEYQYTLFYYDQANNLVMTVPPEAVYPLSSANFPGGTWNGTQPAHTWQLATKYTFNSLNSMIASLTPDGGETKYYQDALKRPRFMQDAQQKIDNYFSYIKYDEQGRPKESGESGFNLPGNCNNLIGTVEEAFSNHADDDAYPSVGWEITQTYYDEVSDSIAHAKFETSDRNLRQRVSAMTYTDGADGLCTQLAGTVHKTANYYAYDEHGNVNELIQYNSLMKNLGEEQTYKNIQYDYDLISTNINEVRYQEGKLDQFIHRYDYDADNRLIHAWTSRDAEIWEQDAKYFYSLHGPLTRIEIGQDKVQGMDYAYTINSWIKTVNGSTLNATRDLGQDGNANVGLNLNDHIGRDGTAFTLGYHTNDYLPINGQLSGMSTSALANTGGIANFLGNHHNLYNGNISHMITAISDLNQAPIKVIGNAYKYDQLQRLRDVDALYAAAGTDGIHINNNFNAWTNPLDAYQVRVTYDKNGNIQTLKRNGYDTGNGSTVMDNMTYRYFKPTDAVTVPNAGRLVNNKLYHVDDAVVGDVFNVDISDQGNYTAATTLGANPENGANYIYDEIGNLTADNAEGIEEVKWNVGGKIKAVIFTAASGKDNLYFTYAPDGTRIAKTIGEGYDRKTTLYVRDATGNPMATYQYEFVPVQGGQVGEYDECIKLEAHQIYGVQRLGTDKVGEMLKERRFIYNSTSQIETTSSYTDGTELVYGFDQRRMESKTYELSNHLGNVLTTISDLKLGIDTLNPDSIADYYTADVRSFSDYYPFGMQMVGRSGNTGGYRYGFQGQETDNEISGTESFVSYKYRMHNARIGRFLSIDPLAPKYPHYSPYSFSGNKVIHRIELEGLEDAETLSPSELGGFELVQSDQVYGASQLNYKAYEAASAVPDPNAPHRETWWEWYKRRSAEGWEGYSDGALGGGELGGEDGWHNGGKQLFFGTIGVLTAPISISAGYAAGGIGGWWSVTTGSITLLNSIDDLGGVAISSGDKGYESLVESFSDNPEYKEMVQNIKAGGTAITTLNGSVQIWSKIDDGSGVVNLVGLITDGANVEATIEELSD